MKVGTKTNGIQSCDFLSKGLASGNVPSSGCLIDKTKVHELVQSGVF